MFIQYFYKYEFSLRLNNRYVAMADGVLDGIKVQSSRFSFFLKKKKKLSRQKKKRRSKRCGAKQNAHQSAKLKDCYSVRRALGFYVHFSDKEKKALTATSKIATQSARDYELNILLDTQHQVSICW